MAMLEVIGALLVIILLVTVLVYVIISGLLEPIVVKTVQTYKCEGYFVYKVYTGDYSNAGPYFTEVNSVQPELECVAIYYDDPKRVPKEQCRCAVGALIKNDTETEKRERMFSNFRSHGYKVKEIKDVGQAVYCSFPFVTQLSVILGVARVYPEMSEYILERRLDAHMFMEHYSGGYIHFIAPLERHDDFNLSEIERLRTPESQQASPSDISVEPPIAPTVGDLPKIDEQLPDVSLTKADEDSASSASSFEEVRQEDLVTSEL